MYIALRIRQLHFMISFSKLRLMNRFLLCFVCILIPVSALAEDTIVTRRDGYLLIWSGILRPSYETNQVFSDVSYEDRGGLEINYGRRRGILEKEDRFFGENPLVFEDAIMWIYRTRNVDELPNMQYENLQAMMKKYPILTKDRRLDDVVPSTAELISMALNLDTQLLKEVHEVSYYADDFHGQGTAFGETFDMTAMTAAHRSLPQDTLLKVTNIDNGKSIVVRINDRGPYKYGRDLDLSLSAFEKLSPLSRGVINATFQRLGDKDLFGKCEDAAPRRYQKRITRDVRFHRGIPHTFAVGDEIVLAANRYFVVRGIAYPDGTTVRIQDYVSPDEKYRFTASIEGEYKFIVGTKTGRRREMIMNVSQCG
ncbi:MAG: septal ring lytic transglycosylase RlpA family protein [bacterium]|nr:septal ring lytic transglycosylase RlpA family protein [bacterium]